MAAPGGVNQSDALGFEQAVGDALGLPAVGVALAGRAVALLIGAADGVLALKAVPGEQGAGGGGGEAHSAAALPAR